MDTPGTGEAEKLLAQINSIFERERAFREDFERLLGGELRAYLQELAVRERLFREDFERRMSDEMRNYVDQRLTHFHLRAPVTFGRDDRVLIHTLDGHRLILDMRESFMAHHLIEHGEWEKPIRNIIGAILPRGGTFIDIGANIGVHSLLAASVAGPTGKVIALEPHPLIRAILRENIEINGLHETVKIQEFAAASKPNLSVPFQYFPQHPAMSGFQVSSERITAFAGTPETIQVSTTTVDEILAPVNFQADIVKIDVEGFEVDVLRGATKALTKNQDTCFLIEFSSFQVIALHGQNAISELWEMITGAKLLAFAVLQEISLDAMTWEQFAVFSGDVLLVHPGSKPHHIAMRQLGTQ